MNRIYFDNSSTSFPKAPPVGEAVKSLIENGCFNINRGGYNEAYALENTVFDTREMLCDMFNFDKVSNVVFTQSITHSLNYITKGFLKSGDHVIVSSMEHNALMRPLVQLQEQGVTFDAAQAEIDGTLNPAKVEALIKPNTKAIMMLHGSNVCGTLLPIKEIGEICKRKNLKFVVDTAQTAGAFPIDMKEMNIDILCFTGHKSLRGPQGIGGFLISDEMVERISPLIVGGTGSYSDSEEIPKSMPDRFESGTMNLPGIVGLNAALNYLNQEGIDNIRNKELAIAKRFFDGTINLPHTRLIGKKDFVERAPIVSLDFETLDNAQIAFELESKFGIMTRCGLHCAPRAHKSLHTFPQGTVRFSFSHFNTDEEVDICINALKGILK
ncbi:MAG: aminotransferase class V-fold PLP-dependent enzyme [Oscillospiraceae bacterium]